MSTELNTDTDLSVSEQQVGELLWDFCKKITKTLYEPFFKELIKKDIFLDVHEHIRFEREIVLLDLWCISRAMISNDEILEYMHQKFLRVCGPYFGEYAEDKVVWVVAKNELTERYAEYYSYWGGSEVTNVQIKALSRAIVRRLVSREGLALEESFNNLVINHLKQVVKALLGIKHEYEIFT